MSHPEKVRALLATLRIANAPSVVSNVCLGVLLGWIASRNFWNPARMNWEPVAAVSIAGLMLYFAGNLANDWFDRKVDEEKRPERALPSGLYEPSSYLIFALILAVGGIALCFLMDLLCGITATTICVSISIYTYYHKKAIWPVIPMGICRAGLYFLGFFSIPSLTFTTGDFETVGLLGVGLFCYIAGLSLSARYEGMKDAPPGPKVISLALLVLPVSAMSCRFMGDYPLESIAGIIPFAIWLGITLTRFRKPIPRYVSALLAAIPLVDLIAVAPLVIGKLHLSRNPHYTIFLAIPVVAFIAGRALQKLAPAT